MYGDVVVIMCVVFGSGVFEEVVVLCCCDV